MGTDGYRPNKKFWVPMTTGYRPEKNFGTSGYRLPGKFSLMPTPDPNPYLGLYPYHNLNINLNSLQNKFKKKLKGVKNAKIASHLQK